MKGGTKRSELKKKREFVQNQTNDLKLPNSINNFNPQHKPLQLQTSNAH